MTPASAKAGIRGYVSRALNEYCPGGHFIPSITYGLAGTIFPHVDPIINDEIRKYNAAGCARKVTELLQKKQGIG